MKTEGIVARNVFQRRSNLFLCLLIYIASSPVAFCQDIATEHTQILNNVELITENIRQLQSLYNQIEMIQNQIQELKSVATYQNDFSASDSTRTTLINLINEGISLSNQTQSILTNMQQQANSLTSNGTMLTQDNDLEQGTATIVQNALTRVQQQRQSYAQEMSTVNGLMAQNNQAVGQTQALQTLNQLTAQTIPQMQLIRELLSEQISMQAAITTKENQEKQDMDNQIDQIIHPIDNGTSSFTLGTS